MINNNLYNEEERIIVDFLKKRNLNKANSVSKKVKPRNSFYTRKVKRCLDFIMSFCGVIALIPVYIGLFFIVLYDVGFPVIYRQTRVGRNGKQFELLKFRSMNEKKDKNGDLEPGNMRVTRIGHFLRKYSLDELPSLFNVLKGEMSIIGPRPLPIFFYDRMSNRHKMRSFVRPGLDCPIVKYTDGELYQRKFENDIWYIENQSLYTDTRLLFFLINKEFDSNLRDNNAKSWDFFVGYDDTGKAIYKGLAKEIFKNQLKIEIEEGEK